MTGFFPRFCFGAYGNALLYPRTDTHHDVMNRSFRQSAAAEESVQREVNKLVYRSERCKLSMARYLYSTPSTILFNFVGDRCFAALTMTKSICHPEGAHRLKGLVKSKSIN